MAVPASGAPRAAPSIAGSATSNAQESGRCCLHVSTGPRRHNSRCKEHTLTYTAANHGKLGNRFETPVEYVGYKLHDPLGKKIGSVQELFLNDNDEPEYIRVKIGFLGSRTVLIPVESVAVNEERRFLVLH